MAGTYTTGGQAQTYAITGPGWLEMDLHLKMTGLGDPTATTSRSGELE